MRWIYLFILLFIQNAHAQELKEGISYPLETTWFLGIDGYGSTYSVQNMVLHKTGATDDFEYTDFSLGPIATVDFINPLKVVVFYEETNTVVFLDNRLNEIERLNLVNIPELANTAAATNAGNNRLWLFNEATQELELFNFRTTQTKTVSLPFPGEFVTMVSNFNRCYVLTENSLRIFNNYGSFIDEIPADGFESIVLSDNKCIGLNKKELYLLDKDAFNRLNLPPLENPIKDLHLSQEILYIYDGELVRTFSLTEPKK